MVLPKLLLFTLIFSEVILHLGAAKCRKGQRLTQSGCVKCPEGYYQPEENDSPSCPPCTRCEINKGSSITKECTKETNRECKCRDGFVPWERDSSTCKCDVGFGLENKACTKCEDGYFNNQVNSPCIKWKECTAGVNTTGTSTSDVICNDLKMNPHITTFITHSVPHRPREKTQTQTADTVATTTSPPRYKVTTKKAESTPIPDPGNYIGITVILFGVFGLLILTAVTCKLHSTPCVQRKTAVQTKDSYRIPVEESRIGDGSLSSLKLNPGEP